SLIRRVLRDAVGPAWWKAEWREGVGWGRELLQPSTMYHSALLTLLGRFGERRSILIKGIAHITGGGIPGKFRRILKKTGYGAELSNLWPLPSVLSDLLILGRISMEEAYRTFCMGNGMLVVLPPEEESRALAMLQSAGIEARVAGTITRDPTIAIAAETGDLGFY
ncbi:phosphoribosylformylglycinamidine cyclo-ligase, partial [Candidatus Peregrinibacteria bacterium]|nr:phosphoribosylformylglycinamidine cyclo-ligase [Candidatus Peregrinibacteria bacterium]